MYTCLHAAAGLNGNLLLDLARSFSPLIELTSTNTVVMDISGLGYIFGGPQDIARHALKLADKLEVHINVAVAANPDDHQARFDLAVALSAKGDRAAAADQLLELIRRDRSWNDQAARKQLLQLFEAWGLMDPESVAARRKLSAIWF